MEDFGARPEDSLTTCLNELEQADIYIGIIGVRFGSIDKETNKSYTQLEYEKAIELNKTVLIYLIDNDNAKVSPSYFDFPQQEKLNIFKDKLKENHTVDFFKDSIDLVDKLNRKFKEYLDEKIEDVDNEDDFEKSEKLINRFFLTPKIYSGKELKLKVKFKDEPFPASKDLCSKFGLSYGKTIGAKMKIIKPRLKVNFDNFENIFIENKQLEEFLELDKSKEYDIYARVFFNEERVEALEASFRDNSYRDYSLHSMSIFAANPNAEQYHYSKGEGQILLLLKEITTTANN